MKTNVLMWRMLMNIKELKEVLSNMDDEYRLCFIYQRVRVLKRWNWRWFRKRIKSVKLLLNTYIKENANEY